MTTRHQQITAISAQEQNPTRSQTSNPESPDAFRIKEKWWNKKDITIWSDDLKSSLSFKIQENKMMVMKKKTENLITKENPSRKPNISSIYYADSIFGAVWDDESMIQYEKT